MNYQTKGIILTAAKADITICEVFGDLPTGLIPINGKPIIFFIIQQMLDNGIKDIYISIDYKKEKLQEIVNLYFDTKVNLHYIETNKYNGVGDSLLLIFNKIKSGSVIINLADTYIKNFNYDNFIDSLVVSDDFLDEERWATVEVVDNQIIKFINKSKSSLNPHAICGLYSLSDIKIFKQYEKIEDSLQINDLLKFYNDKYLKLKIIQTEYWLDFGHIDKYYLSKKRLIQSRGFNFLEYDDLLGTITKRSDNKDKFRHEIKWQLNLPKNIEVLSPRILDYSVDADPFITMEFYSYPTLSEIWLYSELNENIYFSIIDKLFKILELFSKNKKNITQDEYIDMYYNKTLNRIRSIKNNDILNFLELDDIVINNKTYKNWNFIKPNILKMINELYVEKDNCFIHGDFCLSNILYDLRSGIVRLIDPRGIWGNSENGDIKYDIAKLRHSIYGDYDYIVNDLFTVTINNKSINFNILNSNNIAVKDYFDDKLSKSFNLRHIKLIEGLLFISMIPLHSDNSNRQLIMYAKSIKLLNEIYANDN